MTAPSESVVAGASVPGDWADEKVVGDGVQVKVGIAWMLKGTVTEFAAYVAVAAVETVMEHCAAEVAVKFKTTGMDDEFSEQPAVSPVPAIA